MGRDLRQAVCLRKVALSEGAARRYAEATEGLEAYPCPFSIQRYHWHTGHPSGWQANPKWWTAVQERAEELGRLGWPEGLALETIRRRRAEQKAKRCHRRAAG